MDIRQRQLLTEFIKNSLKTINEQEGGSGGMDFGPYYGGSYGSFRSAAEISPGGLMDTFVTPLTDIFKTVVASAKEIAVDVKTLLHVSFKAVIGTFLPFIGQRYDEIFKERDKKIGEIRKEYADVFKRTDEALGGGDAKLFAFMFSPGLFLGGSAALKAPAATKTLLSVSTGGLSDDVIKSSKKSWKKLHDKMLAGKKYKGEDSNVKERQQAFWDSIADEIEGRRKSENLRYGSSMFLFETDSDLEDSKEDRAFLKSMLDNKRILSLLSDRIKNNDNFQDLKDKLIEAEKRTLEKSEKLAIGVLKNANSLDDIKKFLNKPEVNAAIDKVKKSGSKEAPETLLQNLKDASKQTFMAQFKARMELFPKDAPQREMYRDAFEKLKSL